MSIGLEDTEEDQAELYVDFANIFLPLFLRLDQQQIDAFSEKFIFRLASTVPEHNGAYEAIAISLAYIDSSFAGKMYKHIRSKILNFDLNGVNSEDKKDCSW